MAGETKKGQLMTEGNIRQRLMQFAIPMFFCSVFQQLYSTVDAAIVGKFAGAEGLAAIGVTGQIIMLSVSVGLGLMMGISIVVSEHCGRGNWEKVRQAVVVSLFVIFATYLMKVIIGVFLAEPILRAIHTPKEVMDGAVLYLKIVFGGGLFTYAYSMFIYILRACGDGNRPMYFLGFSCICNIVLDLAFVWYLKMGVAGAAIGTVISESIATILCLVYIRKNMPALWPTCEDFRNTGKDMVLYVLKLSVPTCLQNGAVFFCTILVQAVINKYGTMVVAGYAAAQKIQQIIMMVIQSFSGALNTFTAQNRGAGRFDRIREAGKISNRMIAAISLSSTALVLLLGKNILHLFADEGGTMVVEEGFKYLLITSGFYLILGLQQSYTAVLRGMADVLIPLVIGAIQVFTNLAAIWILEPSMGKSGIWWSVAASWVLSMIVAKVRLKKYKAAGL